jgi:hypothetical protein
MCVELAIVLATVLLSYFDIPDKTNGGMKGRSFFDGQA